MTLILLIYLFTYPARQNGDFGQNFTYFPLIFHLFSAYGTPSAHMFTDYAYFHLFFTYFPPVVPHPYYKLKHMLPICRFSAHMFTDFAYFPLISAYFLPKIPPIFRPSCLAGYLFSSWEIFYNFRCRFCCQFLHC